MKISLNTIKQYTDIDLSIDELVARINAQLGGVEGGKDGITDLGKRYEGAVIVRVVSCEDHPNADRLHVCKIDDGGAVKDIERDENGLVQVVCGAPNVHANMFVVWLPPKSTVPASFDEKELFVLDARELRGVVSNGMLASAKELAIGDSHEGILEINSDEWKPSDVEIKPGASFAKAYGLDDTLIEIENKMFTHRPDLFGQLGVAREIAGIQHQKFVSPSWYIDEPAFENAEGLELAVKNEASEKVPRFMAVTLKDIEIKPSPLWLQIELIRLGSKPINNIVDVTNYVMLLTAQPTHAYDYDKLRGHTLVSRMAKKGETVKLLNDKTYELDETDIVIADSEGPVGLAGIMGGGESEVDEHTKNIVLEVATFDMYTVRKSSMRHGVFTDALTRFNKGQSPLQNAHILKLLMTSVFDVSSGEQASDVFDEKAVITEVQPVDVTPQFINERLGLNLAADEIKTLLENVELKVEGELNVTPAFWRTDLEIPEDIVEEVGRLYGYDRLPRELPKRSTKPAPKNTSRELAKMVRETLSRAGANEVLTYSFVHKNIIERAGQNPDEAYQIANALSPDLQYYRLSLTPSLLDKVHGNIKAGHSEFALFEIGKSHSKRAELDIDRLPSEMRRIALTLASKKKKDGSPYYQVKALLEFLAEKLGLKLEYKILPAESSLTLARPFEPKRSARVVDVKSGQVIGIIGEYSAAVKRSFKLPEYSAGFELLPEAIELAMKKRDQGYRPLSKYPSTSRDISFKVASDVAYGEIVECAWKALESAEVDTAVAPFDIYQAEGDDKKTVTISVTLTPYGKTLSSDEANGIIESMISSVAAALDAQII